MQLDVLIVACGRWALTQKTIQSLCDTTPVPLRFVIVDNASEDATKTELEPYLKFLNIEYKLIRLEKRVRSYEGVNISFSHMKNEYVLRTDNDIEYRATWWDVCKNILDTVPRMALVCPTNHYAQYAIMKGEKYEGKIEKVGDVEFEAVDVGGRNVPGNFLTKKAFVEYLGGMYTAFDLLNTDANYCSICVASGLRYCSTKEVLGWHMDEIGAGETAYHAVKVNQWHSDLREVDQINRGDIKEKSKEKVIFTQELGRLMADWKVEKNELVPQEVNVLIPSVGRRVELVREFKKALNGVIFKGKVIGCGNDPYMPAAYECDSWVKVPSIRDEEEYKEALLKICKENAIHIIVPVVDFDCVFIAKMRSAFEAIGVKPIVSDFNVVYMTFDKLKASEYFKEKGIPHPVIYHEAVDVNEDVVIKPQFGFASRKVFYAKGVSGGYAMAYEMEMREPLIQRRVFGKEYTTDIYVSQKGEILSMCHRERVGTRGGEIMVGRVVKQTQQVEEYLEKMANDFRGPINIQYIIDSSGVPWFIEINPRFGGGIPMTIRAGQNQVMMLVKEFSGRYNPKYMRYIAQSVVGMRFDDARYIME